MQDARTKMLVEKWAPLLKAKAGNASPITDSASAVVMSRLLENQEKYLAEQQSQSGDINIFIPILVPTVRRIFPALVANQIVGIQPMAGPTGYAFAWRAMYAGSDTTPSTTGPSTAPTDRGATESSITGPNQISVVIYVPSTVVVGVNVNVADNVRDTTGGGGNIQGVVKYAETTEGFTKVLVLYALTGTTINFPFTVGNNVFFQSSASTANAVSAIFGNETGYNLILRAYAGRMTTATGETLGSAMNAMRVFMERTSVTAQTQKLKAEYTIEMAQDLKAVHNMDAEAELMNVLQYEIAAEIDRELIQAINSNATSTTSWTYGNVGTQANTAWFADGQWEIEKLRTLYTRIVKEANRIAITTRRGAGNFIIASANVVSALEGLNNFMYAQVPNDLSPIGGVTKVGTLDGRFAVYVDTFAISGSDYVTVGYKGPTNMDSGVIYCPYIPIMMQKVIDPVKFQPSIGVLTRSAIAYNMQGTQNYYRKFTTVFTNSQLA